MKTIIRRFDSTIVEWVRHIPRSWDPFFLSVTHLGDPIVVVLISVVVGLWAFVQTNIRLVISAAVVPATLAVGAVLKLLFERARPVGDFSHLLKLDTFSFPSGHSSGSMVAYGLLAFLVWKLVPAPYGYVLAVILICVPLVVGISRVYLSVHHPSDVLAGWLLGLIALGIIIFVVRPL
ncbi:MAG TPA: phosphatase PAP2 family protein [Candidatus Saccharimonadales bacterium]